MFQSPTHFLLHHYGQPGDLELVTAAAHHTEEALKAIERGDLNMARSLWSQVDGDALLKTWNNWNHRIQVVGPKWSHVQPEPIGPPGQPVSPALAKQVYERDQYRCQYCESPVFTRFRGSRIHQLIRSFPDLTPRLTIKGDTLKGTGKAGAIKNVDYSKFLWSMAAPDHVFPQSLGGDATFENVVTSCSGCNYGKGSLTLEQMDVRHPRR